MHIFRLTYYDAEFGDCMYLLVEFALPLANFLTVGHLHSCGH